MVVLHVSSSNAIIVFCHLIIRLHALYNCLCCVFLCFFINYNNLLVFMFYLLVLLVIVNLVCFNNLCLLANSILGPRTIIMNQII